DFHVTGVQTCALPIYLYGLSRGSTARVSRTDLEHSGNPESAAALPRGSTARVLPYSSAGCPRRVPVRGGSQFAVDHLLELSLRLRTVYEDSIDKEARSARNSGLASVLQICFDLSLA